MTSFEAIKQKDQKYCFSTYAPFDIAFVSGNGCTLTDSEGKTYTDFLGGIAVNSLGYNNPIVTDTLCEQAKKLTICSNYFYNEYRGEAAEALLKGTQLDRVFFANSGGEANECAIKLARKFFYDKGQNKYKFITAIDSFHGRTLATVSATGQPKYNKAYSPLPSGFGDYVPFNDIAALEQALDDDSVCALMIELIQGESGILPASLEYAKACRELTAKHGQLLIIDEVQTGSGRSGTFWVYQQYGILPDIVTAAKGIGGGFPIGACLATDAVAAAFHPGDHGTTFGSSALACAMCKSVVSAINNEAFLLKVKEIGAYLKNGLNGIVSPYITEVRGLGLMLGVQLNDKIQAKDVVKAMLNKGYVLNACGHNVLRCVPPLVITKSEIDNMLSALKEVLA